MLEKGGRVADSKSDTLLKLHQNVNDVNLNINSNFVENKFKTSNNNSLKSSKS